MAAAKRKKSHPTPAPPKKNCLKEEKEQDEWGSFQRRDGYCLGLMKNTAGIVEGGDNSTYTKCSLGEKNCEPGDAETDVLSA